MEFENCNPADALLGEVGVIEKYARELTRDWWDVYVVKHVGQDSNVLYLPELFLDSLLIDSYTHPKWIYLFRHQAETGSCPAGKGERKAR